VSCFGDVGFEDAVEITRTPQPAILGTPEAAPREKKFLGGLTHEFDGNLPAGEIFRRISVVAVNVIMAFRRAMRYDVPFSIQGVGHIRARFRD
jgi:hypothetical protein